MSHPGAKKKEQNSKLWVKMSRTRIPQISLRLHAITMHVCAQSFIQNCKSMYTYVCLQTRNTVLRSYKHPDWEGWIIPITIIGSILASIYIIRSPTTVRSVLLCSYSKWPACICKTAIATHESLIDRCFLIGHQETMHSQSLKTTWLCPINNACTIDFFKRALFGGPEQWQIQKGVSFVWKNFAQSHAHFSTLIFARPCPLC